jgi:hypothetical protein
MNRIQHQLKELWDHAEGVARQELENNHPDDFEQIDAKKVKQTIEKIDKALAGKPVDKKVKQKLNYSKKNCPENLDKYDRYEQQIGNRKSMYKTDPDATFMRMKEDHMLNGQLKPGYNRQIRTQNQYVLDYTIHQDLADTSTLQIHVDSLIETLGDTPEVHVADAGYGSERNYEYLEDKGIEAYVKYNNFHKEQTKKWKENPRRIENLHYNPEKDCYYCPMGQPMTYIGASKRKSHRGYEQSTRLYQAQSCQGCQ